MEALRKYPPERRAQFFIEELKDTCAKVEFGNTDAQGKLLGMFCQPFQDLPSMLTEIGKDAERHFNPRQRASVEMGRYLMGRFNSNFGYDSSVWGLGILTHDNPHLNRYFTESATLILGLIERFSERAPRVTESLIGAHAAFQGLLDHIEDQLRTQPVAS